MPDHPLKTLSQIDEDIMQHVKDMNGFVFNDGALPRKVKLLIALAFDAAQGAREGVRALADAAIHEGATLGEIAEAIRVAYHLSGVGTLYTASAGLKEVIE